MKLKVDKLDDKLVQKQIGLAELSEKAGVAKYYLYRIHRGEVASAETMGKLADALGCRINEIACVSPGDKVRMDAENLEAAIEKSGLNFSKLAKISGIACGTLRTMRAGGTVRYGTAELVAEALQTGIEDIAEVIYG